MSSMCLRRRAITQFRNFFSARGAADSVLPSDRGVTAVDIDERVHLAAGRNLEHDADENAVRAKVDPPLVPAHEPGLGVAQIRNALARLRPLTFVEPGLALGRAAAQRSDVPMR